MSSQLPATTIEQAAPRASVAIFAKPPRPGEVKTRLAADIGEQPAAELARAFLLDTLSMVRQLPKVDGCIASTELEFGIPALADVDVLLQGDGDLGARIENVMRQALERAPVAISIGADAPSLPSERIEAALDAMETVDAVLGPAEDGGFYLLALRRCPEGLLRALPWSQADTLDATLSRLRSHGMEVTLLEPWFDVDTVDDLPALASTVHHETQTAHVLRTLRRSQRVSVIIPVLNEESRIREQLDYLSHLPGIDELVVADGGSSDSTRDLVVECQKTSRIPLLYTCTEAGRARQMNKGASTASGEVLFFVHADVRPPRDAARWIREALSDSGVVAGAFRTWTVDDTGQDRLGPLLHLADFRSRYSGLPYGDQCIFVRRSTFEAVGGYPGLPLMEDLALSQNLRQQGRIEIVPASALVSGRRFIARPIFYTALVNIYPALFRLGVPAAWLDRFYRAVR